MIRCQFIYIRKRGGNLAGDQCKNEAEFIDNTLCKIHRHFRGRSEPTDPREDENDPGCAAWQMQLDEPLSDSSANDFPRQCSAEEVREWVEEARRKTSPMCNWRRGCIICGRATMDVEMVPITVSDLVILKKLLKDTLTTFLQHVDPAIFRYMGSLAAIDGLPIDKNGILTADELIIGSPVIARGCQICYTAIRKHKIPQFALGNRLWTGIEVETPLTDLSWIEEKLIARVHVSVQIQKCRMFSAWAADGFHPQRQVQGHILSYPMEPTVILQKLPLSVNKLIGLIKVVFLSRKPITHANARKLRFYIVRREKVVHALHWLMLHNPYYRDVQLDPAAIAQLPLDGIPKEVYEQLIFSDRAKDDDEGHSRYDAPDRGTTSLRECSLTL